MIPTPFLLAGEGFSLSETRIVAEHLGKLRWRCRRGMKELDLLTLGYLERHYPTASAEEQQAFAELLEVQDPLLMSYMVGREIPVDATTARVVGVIRTLLSADEEVARASCPCLVHGQDARATINSTT